MSKNLAQSKINPLSNEAESSLNMSMSMVKSMSKSMLGSLKSIESGNLNQSMYEKGNASMRSSKVVQNLSKQHIEPATHGKNLSLLFDKGKNLS